MNLLKRYLSDFWSLFFPTICCGCKTALAIHENMVCTKCIYNLPYTDHHLDSDNQLQKTFWGRVQIERSSAFLYFKQGGAVQNMMHQLKYNNQPLLGVWLGEQYGKKLKTFYRPEDYQAIIPVPIHRVKKKKRGYNQSEQIALGLSEELGIPVINDLLLRVKNADSQVQKNRISRHENLKCAFATNTAYKHIKKVILVDDTITTGATLEACVQVLNQKGIFDIAILGIAYTA